MQELEVGQQLEEQGKLQEAILAYRKAVKAESNSVAAHHSLAKALTKKGHWKEAIRCYQKMVEIEPSSFDTCHKLGKYLKQLGYLDKAIALYKQVGDSLSKKNQLDKAIQLYQVAIELDLDPKWFYVYIGDLENRRGNLEAAVTSYLKAIKIAPEFWQPHDRLLIKLQRQELSTELMESMIPVYQEVIEKRPDYLLSYSNLGDIFTKVGRIDEAISQYQTASYRQNLKLKPEFVDQAWDDKKKGQEPKFIIIGSMRCGTTSLYKYLTFHPQFVPAMTKEVKFFNFNFEAGKDWYLAHFPPIREGSSYLTGEGSPDYLYYPIVAQRIHDLFPDMKLIVMLRNPVERAISQYYHWVKVGAEYRSLEASINSDLELVRKMANPAFDGKLKRKGKTGCLLESVYIYFLEKWMSIFPKEQFLILKSEDFYTNTAKTMREIYDFIGLPDYQLSEYQTFNAGCYDKIDTSTRRTIVESFRLHNQRLEEFLDMRFNWDN